MKKKSLLKLRHLCSSGLPALTIMPLVSKQVHELISCLSFSFIYVDDVCRPLEYYAEHFDEKTLQLFNQSGAELVITDNDPASFKLLFALPAACGNLLNPPDAFYQSSNYQHFFAPNGIYHVMDMQLTDNGKPIAMSAIFREKTRLSTFSQHEQQLMTAIHNCLQHLALAPNSFNQLEHTPLFSDAIEESSYSLVVNQQGKILLASAQATELLKVGLSTFQRSAIHENDFSEIFKHLTQRVQKNTTELPVLRIAIPGGMLVLRAYRLENLTSGSDVQTPDMTTIHISKQVPVAYTVWDNLMKLKLTAQEQRVAWLLCQGKDAPAIEQQLGIKTSTYRTYVKNLLGQCQVNSQTDLVSLLTHSY